MILRILYIFSICTLASASYAEKDIWKFMDEQKEESLSFNETVTDKEIIEYFEAFLKYQPSNLELFQEHSPEERNLFIKNYKQSHIEAGIKIPILRGLSKDEMQTFDEIAKYKAGESIRIESAQERLTSFSNEQYKLMVRESIKLINNYVNYPKEKYNKQIIINNDFPESLSFLKLESIYLYPTYCELLLQNGIGKDIGYIINKGEDNLWHIESYDHYKNWESTKIIID